MRNKLRVKKGDTVVVIAGKDKGKRGAVLRAIPEERRVVVQGVNVVKRHTKPSATNPGGIVEKEASIHVSNVAIADPKSGKPTRVGIKTLEDGRRVRVAKDSGEVIDR
ncbi:MAG: 50S ribosomal protein L24 [Alphaproteobacteria bacterium]|nr:50S ribosomal protein L24 [Alphaproteobacteria bacterium]